jgi:hypothetical protein
MRHLLQQLVAVGAALVTGTATMTRMQVGLLGDAYISLSHAMSSLGDAESSLGDAKSSLGDAESSLGDAESSLSRMQLFKRVRVEKLLERRGTFLGLRDRTVTVTTVEVNQKRVLGGAIFIATVAAFTYQGVRMLTSLVVGRAGRMSFSITLVCALSLAWLTDSYWEHGSLLHSTRTVRL